MAKRNNKNPNRNEKHPSEFAFCVEEGRVVNAKEIADKCKEQNIDPNKLTFLCPGRSLITGEECKAELTLCSYRENNLKQPYFAYRGNKKDHIKNCDCANDYISLQISRTVDRTLSKLNPNLLLEKLSAGDCKTTVKPKDSEDKKSGGNTEEKSRDITITETERKYVPINNIVDMYIVLAVAVNRAPHNRTLTGEMAETLLVNSKTAEKYKNNELSIDGIKLVVASRENMNPNDISEMKEHIDGAFWVLKDACDDENPIYYVLSSKDKQIIKKTLETINPTAKNQRKLLVLGIVEKQNKFNDKIVCKIEIKGINGGQIKELKEKDSLE